MDRLKIDTEHLRIGLYVSDLDRPWLDTPFLFQGFTVENDEDLTTLRELCQSVIVDLSRSTLGKDELDALMRKIRDESRRRTDADGQSAPTRRTGDVKEPDLTATGRRYRNTEDLGKELERAQALQKDASREINSVIDRVRDGGSLKVPQLQQVIDPLVDSVLRNSDAMAWLMRIRNTDEYVYQHSIGSSVWAMVFGRHLGFDKQTLNSVGLGGLLLDIGKTRLPTDLLRKTGLLSDDEQTLMRTHVELGLEILRESGKSDASVELMVATHHERFDGSGYPGGLKGVDIPVLGRIAGIVDCYDAMVSKRPYAIQQSTFDAMRQLQLMARDRLQPEMVDQFVQAIGMFPTGSLVELNTGEVAVVTSQNSYQRLRPEVMIILDRDKNPCSEFRTIDLRKSAEDERGNQTQWIDRGLEPGSYGIDPAEYFL